MFVNFILPVVDIHVNTLCQKKSLPSIFMEGFRFQGLEELFPAFAANAS